MVMKPKSVTSAVAHGVCSSDKRQDRMRLLREVAWNDAQALEDDACSPYVPGAGESSNESLLEDIQRRISLIMQTNVKLQEKTAEQERLIETLQDNFDRKESEWENLQDTLRKGKAQHTQLEEQFREMRELRRTEEMRLRERGNELRRRGAALARENARLEDHLFEAERQVVQNEAGQALLVNEMSSLRKRKQKIDRSFGRTEEFDEDDDVDNDTSLPKEYFLQRTGTRSKAQLETAIGGSGAACVADENEDEAEWSNKQAEFGDLQSMPSAPAGPKPGSSGRRPPHKQRGAAA